MSAQRIRGFRWFGFAAVVMLLLVLATAGVPTANGADPPSDEAAWLFDPDAVFEIDLGLSKEGIEALEVDPDEYQPGTFELRVDGVPQGQSLGEVGIRLKGGLGSFRPLSKKAAFKIKFDEYVDDQTFFGLERLTLNNMVQDPSMVHETLTYEMARALGLPASRTGYAFVRLNGLTYGLYLNVETLDEVSLPRWFGSTGHLYEADAPGVDVGPGGAGDFEVDEGDDEDLSDLEALIVAANAEAGDWSDGMAAVADLDQMAGQWAVERYVGHWDGYTGQAEPPHLTPNNYYLHSDGAGVFRMLPWGTDQTWTERLGFDDPAGGLLFNRCLAEESCGALYADALEEVHSVLDSLELGQHAAGLLELLAPYRALEAEPRLEETPAEVAASIEATCAFIAERPAELRGWLEAAGRSPSNMSLEPPCRSPGAQEADEREPATVALSSSPASVLWIGRSRLIGNSVATSFALPGPGRVRQLVTARLGKHRRVACAAQKEAAAAGPTELRCRLSAAARQRLTSGSLALLATASFRPPDGDPGIRRRRVVAPQMRP